MGVATVSDMLLWSNRFVLEEGFMSTMASALAHIFARAYLRIGE